MIFTPLHLPGAFVIEMQKIEDERGFFAGHGVHGRRMRKASSRGLLNVTYLSTSIAERSGNSLSDRTLVRRRNCPVYEGSLFDVALICEHILRHFSMGWRRTHQETERCSISRRDSVMDSRLMD